MQKDHLKKIKAKIEAEWPEKSVYCFDSKGRLNDCGRVYAELLSRRNAERVTERVTLLSKKKESKSPCIFQCLVCNFCHSYDKCPPCKTKSDYS